MLSSAHQEMDAKQHKNMLKTREQVLLGPDRNTNRPNTLGRLLMKWTGKVLTRPIHVRATATGQQATGEPKHGSLNRKASMRNYAIIENPNNHPQLRRTGNPRIADQARWIPIPIRAKSTRRHGTRLPLAATKKGESMENRGWLRPRAESSSRSGAPAPARGPLAAAAAAGRQEREDESLLPATLSIVSSSSSASSGGGARLQSDLG